MGRTIERFVQVRSDHSFKENILHYNLNTYFDKKLIITYFPIYLFLSKFLIPVGAKNMHDNKQGVCLLLLSAFVDL